MMGKLYHGSGFNNEELKPGIHYTGELVQWDETESNEWLYASSSEQEAAEQGFISAVEKKFNLSRSRVKDDKITLYFEDRVPALHTVLAVTVFLYCIHWDRKVWVKVNNKHNGIDTEYKTKSVIESKFIHSRTPVDIKKMLNGRELVLLSAKSALNW